jgi:amphi-Trp domain-containing protein
MSSRNNEFKHESYQDRETILEYLNAIVDGITKGTMTLGDEKNRIDLEPEGLLKFKIEAKRKEDRSKLSLQVSWKNDPRIIDTRDQKLTISPAAK